MNERLHSLGFGLERIATLALAHRRVAWMLLAVVAALVLLGLTRISFDEALRQIFRGDTEAYRVYAEATANFADPENETLVLVEGDGIGRPQTFSRLQDFHFELQLAEGVDSVFSLFSLRAAPDAAGNAPTLVEDPAAGLTPELISRIRAHPVLGEKALSADGAALLFGVTPNVPKADLAVHRALHGRIRDIAANVLAGSGLTVTVSGFPAIRAGIVDILVRDQKVLNIAGAIVGFLLSLVVFGALRAAILTAVPAIVGGATVLGAMGLLGLPVTVMSTVVPALVMILGYADALHLNSALRRHRDNGSSIEQAERLALQEIGPAIVLTAMTTAVAFMSLTISDVEMVSSFGLAGSFGILLGSLTVLSVHALLAPMLAKGWTGPDRLKARRTLLDRLAGPSGAIARFAGTRARSISAVAVILLAVFGALHLSVPPEHSIREHLGRNNPANAALGRIDQIFGGAFPVQIIVPLHGASASAPDALARIGAVHRAVAGVEGAGTTLSLWSLAQWIAESDNLELKQRIDDLLNQLSPKDRTHFIGQSGDALITVSIAEAPTSETRPLVDRIEAAAQDAGGAEVVATGVTVLTARESDRTIANLNLSLMSAVIAGLVLIALAFRDWRIGVVAFIPNSLPILATGSLLFVLGRGMQFTSVIALTVAFGIAVDSTIHFLSGYRQLQTSGNDLQGRLIATARRIGPVLVGTTLVIIAGLMTTATSGLPTIVLFGQLVMVTLAAALVGDLIFLPALMAGPARSWFKQRVDTETTDAGKSGKSGQSFGS